MSTPSLARLRANRRNAAKSTGPITEAGKKRSRANALKHGLASEGEARLPEEEEAVARRMEEWKAARPDDPPKLRWLAEKMVLASVRIDRCQLHQRRQSERETDRAVKAWELDREVEIEDLAAQLPKRPGPVVARLKRSPQGLEWLIHRWRILLESLGMVGWDEDQAHLALNLLGAPLETRALDVVVILQTSPTELYAIVEERIQELEALLPVTTELEETDRAMAEHGTPATEPTELRRLRRYEAAHWRRFDRAEAALHGHRNEHIGSEPAARESKGSVTVIRKSDAAERETVTSSANSDEPQHSSDRSNHNNQRSEPALSDRGERRRRRHRQERRELTEESRDRAGEPAAHRGLDRLAAIEEKLRLVKERTRQDEPTCQNDSRAVEREPAPPPRRVPARA